MSKMKSQTDVVVDVINLHKDMNALSVDKINETAPKIKEVEPQTKISLKELAKAEGVRYIEPKKKLQAFGVLPECQRADHARDWEYVKGIFENEIVRGEGIPFWYSKYAGDPDCLWEIPANTPVYVPRMLATHLETCMQYHTFSYIAKPENHQRKDDFQDQFSATNTLSRGKFRPIGAFA